MIILNNTIFSIGEEYLKLYTWVQIYNRLKHLIYSFKSFVLRIVTWSSNCLLRVIIIRYLKAYNSVQIICIKNSYLKL